MITALNALCGTAANHTAITALLQTLLATGSTTRATCAALITFCPTRSTP